MVGAAGTMTLDARPPFPRPRATWSDTGRSDPSGRLTYSSSGSILPDTLTGTRKSRSCTVTLPGLLRSMMKYPESLRRARSASTGFMRLSFAS